MLIEKDLKVGIVSNHKKEIEKINALLLKDFPNKKGIAIYNEEGHLFNKCKIDGKERHINKNLKRVLEV